MDKNVIIIVCLSTCYSMSTGFPFVIICDVASVIPVSCIIQEGRWICNSDTRFTCDTLLWYYVMGYLSLCRGFCYSKGSQSKGIISDQTVE